MFADGEAKTASAILARGRCIDLTERLEEPGAAIWRNSNARISNGEVQHSVSIIAGHIVLARRLRESSPNDYLAGLREFDGIAEQVGQDLPDACDVADDVLGHIVFHQVGQFQPLSAGGDGNQV